MKKLSIVLMVVAAVTCMVAVPAFSADKLIVKDTLNNNGFVVTNDVRVGVGTPSPAYVVDVSAGNVSKSALHFSLNGADTGGWLTAVADNNFWMSSGAMWDNAAGGWVQKSPDGNAVMIGSGSAGLRVFTRSGCAVGTVCPTVNRFRIDYNGNLGLGIGPNHPLHLAGGAYSDGATWVNASSREYKEDIKDLSTEAAMSTFDALKPVTFKYKTGDHVGHVGFIAEDVPDLVATKDRKGLSAMDIVAVLTKVVQEQQETIAKMSEKLERLEREMQMKGAIASGASWSH
jgi:hypothetical protein